VGKIVMLFGYGHGWSKEACVRWGAGWRHLANTIETSVCGSNLAFVSNYFDHLLLYYSIPSSLLWPPYTI